MAYVINTVRDGEVANTWVTSDVQKAIEHAQQCVKDYAITDVKRGMSVPSQIVVTRVGGEYNEVVWGWLPEDLEETV